METSTFVALWLTSLITATLSLTQSRDPEQVRFYLYQNERSARLDVGQEIKLDDSPSLSRSLNLRKGAVTKILIHGFRHNSDCWFPQELKDAYINRGRGENIITVDWGPLTNPTAGTRFLPALAYPRAVQNVQIVGKRVGQLIESLVSEAKIPPNSIHIVGLSLGAHVAGVAGAYIAEKFHKRIGRITGLDPAGPMFRSTGNARSLSKEDAIFVDVVHTNQGAYGLERSLGHIDFFVNGGGPSQPDCGTASCSHNAGANYYLQSIQSDSFYGCKCQSYSAFKNGHCGGCNVKSVFGDGAKDGATEGTYYLDMRLGPLSGKYNC